MSEYIEREALKGAFQDIDAGHRDGWTTSLSPEEAADYLAEYLDDIPAADVAPVKHGHWIDDGGYGSLNHGFINQYKCSVCGVRADYCKGTYCSHCGAKMDGGNDNDR